MLRMSLIGLVISAIANPVIAASHPRNIPKRTAVEIINGSDVVLNAFTLSTRGEKPKIVAKIVHPLAPDAKVNVRVVGAKECELIARWEVVAAESEAVVDICNDPHIVVKN